MTTKKRETKTKLRHSMFLACHGKSVVVSKNNKKKKNNSLAKQQAQKIKEY
jgi:hypothetical protein